MAYTDIDNPELHFQNQLYTGTGSSQSITLDGDKDMQPDWVWCKTRNDTQDHQINDSVRGTTKLLATNNNAQEFTDSNNLTSYNTDGFTVGSSGGINGSSDTLASWNWKAGGSASSNSDGSISSSVSVNTTAGFSIVSFTTPSSGTFTVGHGLSSVPKVWIHKRRDGSDHWQFYHESVGNTKKLLLSANNAESTSAIWKDTTPPSSIMYLGAAGTHLNASATYIAYCFSEKKGYSKFGKWTGNGNADGPFVYTGFRPAWILRKEISNADVWIINDTKRSTINNGSIAPLYPHLTNSEPSGVNFDFLSNGFKIRNTDGDSNTLNATFIYMAFAESPFVNSSGVPCNAK